MITLDYIAFRYCNWKRLLCESTPCHKRTYTLYQAETWEISEQVMELASNGTS